MNKSLVVFIVIWLVLTRTAAAFPSAITYQGTLKEKTLPANGTKTMFFRITSQDGLQVYWSSGNLSVPVTNGLFSVPLSPTGVDWESTVPYIEVSIEGQLLLPREPVNATVYAVISQSVVDGSVTTAKLAPQTQQSLVPAGAVMLFAGPCPATWTRFAALDNAFPMGSASYGATGGSSTHSHGISLDGAHNHGGWTGQGDSPGVSDAGANFGNQNGWHRHDISVDGSHNHGGSTGAASSLPPYLSMLFCQKN